MNEYCVCLLTPEHEQIRAKVFAHTAEEAERKVRRYIPEIVKITGTLLLEIAF